MIEKMNVHYSMTNPATAYDEEALTTLELVGRTTAKVNEVVESQNNLVEETTERLATQETVIIPENVEKSVLRHINMGTFDAQIDDHTKEIGEQINGVNAEVSTLKSQIISYDDEMGVLESRVSNLLGSYKTGGTTADAELIDLRVDPDGVTHTSAGESIRSCLPTTVNYIQEGDLNTYKTPMVAILADGIANNPFKGTAIFTVEICRTYAGYSPFVLQKVYSIGSKKSAWRVLDVTEWVNASDKDWINFINAGNLNEYFTTNLYAVVTASTNQPENGVGLLEVQKHKAGASGGTWTLQRWYGVNSGNTFYRVHDGNVWLSWNKINGGEASQPLAGKKIVFLGDSVYGNNQGSTGIVSQFAGYTGAICYNFAIGGTRAKKREGNSGWEMLDGESLAESIASGDFSAQIKALETMDNELYYFDDTITAMSNFDFSTADYVICAYGTNDWTGNGNTADYLAAIENIMEKVHSACPHAVFIKVTPTQRWLTDDDVHYASGSVYTNQITGLTLKDFIDADRSLVDACNIQVVDVFNIGINNWTKDYFFTAPDYTHPNSNGAKRIAMYLAGQIR